MAIDRTPWNALVDDDGSNLVGTVWNKDKIKTVILDPTDAAIAPYWSFVPFSAANFTSSSCTWTVAAGNISHLYWVLNGRTVSVVFRITGNMTLSAAATSLTIKLPAPVPVTVIPYVGNPFTYYMTGANGTGIAEINTNGTISLTRDVAGTQFPSFTSAFFIGQMSYPV